MLISGGCLKSPKLFAIPAIPDSTGAFKHDGVIKLLAHLSTTLTVIVNVSRLFKENGIILTKVPRYVIYIQNELESLSNYDFH